MEGASGQHKNQLLRIKHIKFWIRKLRHVNFEQILYRKLIPQKEISSRYEIGIRGLEPLISFVHRGKYLHKGGKREISKTT